MERDCKNCIHYPCLRINCGEVCNQYKTEVQQILEEIDKILEEGYCDFERTKIGGNKMDGNDKRYIKNREKEKQRQQNILEYQRKFFKKKMR